MQTRAELEKYIIETMKREKPELRDKFLKWCGQEKEYKESNDMAGFERVSIDKKFAEQHKIPLGPDGTIKLGSRSLAMRPQEMQEAHRERVEEVHHQQAERRRQQYVDEGRRTGTRAFIEFDEK